MSKPIIYYVVFIISLTIAIAEGIDYASSDSINGQTCACQISPDIQVIEMSASPDPHPIYTAYVKLNPGTKPIDLTNLSIVLQYESRNITYIASIRPKMNLRISNWCSGLLSRLRAEGSKPMQVFTFSYERKGDKWKPNRLSRSDILKITFNSSEELMPHTFDILIIPPTGTPTRVEIDYERIKLLNWKAQSGVRYIYP